MVICVRLIATLPTRWYPTQPNPTQPNPTQPNPTKVLPTLLKCIYSLFHYIIRDSLTLSLAVGFSVCLVEWVPSSKKSVHLISLGIYRRVALLYRQWMDSIALLGSALLCLLARIWTEGSEKNPRSGYNPSKNKLLKLVYRGFTCWWASYAIHSQPISFNHSHS